MANNGKLKTLTLPVAGENKTYDICPSWENIEERPLIDQGTGENSIVFGDNANAQGVYSVAGGTNDKELIKDIIGGSGVLGDIIVSMEDIEAPTAEAPMSMSFGAGTKSIALGSMAVGLNTITGCKGYYWQNFVQNSDGTYTIQLSTTQPELKTSYSANSITSYTLTYYLSDATPPTSIPWKVGDEISIRNTQEYAFCSKITAIDAANGTITVDGLPFTENTYVPAPFTGGLSVILEMIKNLANTFYPFDLTIKVPSKPTSGVVDCSWVSFAHGYNNNSTGMVSSTFGMNNIADGQASFVTGGGNKGGHMALVGGRYNVASGDSSFAAGYKNNATGLFSSATGSNTTAEGAYSSSEGYGTIARYTGSHVEGRETLDGDEFQHVHGKWNTPVAGAWVVGGGSSDSYRRNLATLDWNGQLNVAGDVQGQYNGESVGLGYTWNALKQARTDLTTVYNRVGNTPVADQISSSLEGYSTTTEVEEKISDSLENFSIELSTLDKLYATVEGELNTALSEMLVQVKDGCTKSFEVTPRIYEENFSGFINEDTVITDIPTVVGGSINWNGAVVPYGWSATMMGGSVILQPHVEEDGNACIKMTPKDTGRMQIMYRIPEDIYSSLIDGGLYKVTVKYRSESADFKAQLEAKAASTWSVVPFDLIDGEWIVCEHEFTVDKSFGSLTLTFGVAWPGGTQGSLYIDNVALTKVVDSALSMFDEKPAVGHLYRANNRNAVVSFATYSESGNKLYEKTLCDGEWLALRDVSVETFAPTSHNHDDRYLPKSTTAASLGAMTKTAVRYPYTSGDNDESRFEAWLDELLSKMASGEVIPIRFTVYPAISGQLLSGFLFNHAEGYAELLATTYLSEIYHKYRWGGSSNGWQPTLRMNLINGTPADFGHTHDDRYYQPGGATVLTNQNWNQYISTSGGGSAGMVREFDSGYLYRDETKSHTFSYNSNLSKFYTIMVSNDTDYSETGTTDDLYPQSGSVSATTVDYMAIANVIAARKLLNRTEECEVWIATSGASVKVTITIVGTTVTFKVDPTKCRLVNICGYY